MALAQAGAGPRNAEWACTARGAHLEAHAAVAARAVQQARPQRDEAEGMHGGAGVLCGIVLPHALRGRVPHRHAAGRAARRHRRVARGHQRQAQACRRVGGGVQRQRRRAARCCPVGVGVEHHAAAAAAGSRAGEAGRGGGVGSSTAGADRWRSRTHGSTGHPPGHRQKLVFMLVLHRRHAAHVPSQLGGRRL